MGKRFVIIRGGPGGNQAATHAARFGAEVTLIEKDIVGGGAHLLDVGQGANLESRTGAYRSSGAATDARIRDALVDWLRDESVVPEANLWVAYDARILFEADRP